MHVNHLRKQLMFQELEDELTRMKLELKQITEKYNAACQEAVTAREKVNKDTVFKLL